MPAKTSDPKLETITARLANNVDLAYLKSSVSVVGQIRKLPVPKDLILTKAEQSDLKGKAKELPGGSIKRAKAPAARRT